jgi:hypothetical protein
LYKISFAASQSTEKGLKSEWTALKRMQCLLGTFAIADVERADAIQVCKNKDAEYKSSADDNCSLTYPSEDPQKTCKPTEKHAGEVSYKTDNYGNLPSNGQAKACTAVCCKKLASNTGSPDSNCNCVTVDLQGKPFEPKALAKCTGSGCRDVYRSTDTNSCPENWKIFSPRSRSDWQTLIDVNGGQVFLAAPHFIVDVTRPSNGCGGCTSNPMNSGVAQQSSWVTTDGTAWWLRSSNYGEPNGDYTANCYLYTYSVSNADSIAFNDGSCSYHSSSYFCQPKGSTQLVDARPVLSISTS